MPDIEFLDVIAVGAHPDDVEIACGGTLAKLAKQGHRVGIIDLTDGEPTPLSASPEVRLAEAQQAAKCLGIHKRITLDLPNRKLFDSYDARVKLATEFRRYRPKIVIGFGDKTPMASPDHWQAMLITDAAVFYSRLTKWDDQFDGTSPHTISSHVYFRLSFEPQTMGGFSGGFTVDIGSTLGQKMESIQCYQTQFPKHKQHVLERVESVAISQGAACGYKAGESFVTTRPLGTRNFMQTLLGTPH
ncbi:MAG: PIG-L family deacetylase [Planctomycetota bacterium]|nr:PIG-L family deacetylase [Planctomycetota bacterium]